MLKSGSASEQEGDAADMDEDWGKDTDPAADPAAGLGKPGGKGKDAIGGCSSAILCVCCIQHAQCCGIHTQGSSGSTCEL